MIPEAAYHTDAQSAALEDKIQHLENAEKDSIKFDVILDAFKTREEKHSRTADENLQQAQKALLRAQAKVEAARKAKEEAEKTLVREEKARQEARDIVRWLAKIRKARKDKQKAKDDIARIDAKLKAGVETEKRIVEEGWTQTTEEWEAWDTIERQREQRKKGGN